MSKNKKKIKKALKLIERFGMPVGQSHKQWMIDQMVRALTGDKYDKFIADIVSGEDGPETYDWDIGIAP